MLTLIFSNYFRDEKDHPERTLVEFVDTVPPSLPPSSSILNDSIFAVILPDIERNAVLRRLWGN